MLSGALTVRRFNLVGTLPEGWRESYRDKLNEHAFKDNAIEVGKEEREGWVQIHNLLETSFDDFNKWLYNDLVIVSLRTDKKSLPAKLLKATLEKAYADWCEENGAKRCPKAVREDIREALEAKWLRRALPKVATLDLCLNLRDRYAILHSLSDTAADRVRKRVFATFGLRLVATSPLDLVSDVDLRAAMLDTVAGDIGDPNREVSA
jgi:recombination associated protein RdgC